MSTKTNPGNPAQAAASDALGRREWMQLLGASLALSGLGACTQSPREKILPYVHRPPDVTPGEPQYYATSMQLDGFATGLLVKSHVGRPIKIEGNPDHPASLGAAGVHEQASVLDLYDPARLSGVQRDGHPATWEQALAALPRDREARVWFVLPPQSSPLAGAWLSRVRERMPRARFCFHTPLPRRSVYQATRALFGEPLEPQYDFRRARVILALDADFLSSMPFSLRWARDVAERRRLDTPDGEMSRLYAAEPMLTATGSLADHRLPLRPSQLPRLAASVLGELGAALNVGASALPAGVASALPRADASPHAAWVRAVARDLASARGESIVITGEQSPLGLQLLALALNAQAGNLGRTVAFTRPALLEPEGGAPLADLAAAIDAGEVDAVLILDSNPAYSSPPELELARRLRRVPNTWHLTSSLDETSAACRWCLPLCHYLESWGDARAYDGTVSFVQPLIEPLHGGRSLVEVLAACAGAPSARGHALLTEHWRRELGARFDSQWEEWLKRGLAPGSAAPAVPARADFAAASAALLAAAEPVASAGLELAFEASPSLHDGRFANNAWLLELPHPVTKQAWGNAALLSPRTAARLELETGRVIELGARGRTLAAPVLVVPGHADEVITLTLGHGRRGAGLAGRGVGVNAFALRPGPVRFVGDVVVRPTDRSERLAITQEYSDPRGRSLGIAMSLEEYRARPESTAHLRGPQPSLLRLYEPRGGPQWAMTIDTSICIGCSSCMVACQAENNVPVVGKADVERGRQMHWLRIDRYVVGSEAQPYVVHQPMLCQHCEAAPCEYVCPVNATVHSPDGLNEMVYNRCIGTRFCSNNCPYKVRRFNWFEYTDERTSLALQRNPDVTVRERGVMEKCTFCVQRLRRAEIQARIEQRPVRPGEVETACQQACPTRAIQFGALGHEQTPMVQWRKQQRPYAALHDLGTRPRVQYLAKITNPNPELKT